MEFTLDATAFARKSVDKSGTRSSELLIARRQRKPNYSY